MHHRTAIVAAALSSLASLAMAAEPLVSDVDIFGRFVYDYAFAQGDQTVFDIDGGEVRTGRIGVSLALFGAAKLKAGLAIDAAGEIAPIDLYVEGSLTGGDTKFRIGQFKTPNSLDEQTSSRFTALHERPAFTDAFQLNRRVGVALTNSNDNYSLTLGLFAQNIRGEETFGGYAVAARATYLPISNDRTQIHTGISVRYRDLDAGQPNLGYRQRPFINNSGRILSTGELGTSDFFAGVELAVTNKNVWAAGEYAVTVTQCAACIDDPTLTGGYVEAGVMFGGRRRLKGGKFVRPEIDGIVGQGGLGALALTARFDHIDLVDGSVNGGAYAAVTLGGDWWPTRHVRFGINGFLVNADLGDVTSGVDPVFAAAIMSGVSEEKVLGVSLRGQFDF